MAPHPRLGDLLVKAGLISDSQLRVALAQQRQHGGKLGEHLVRINLVTENQLAIALADQLGLAYNDCSELHASTLSHLIPQDLAEKLQVLPVRVDAERNTLHVAMADPTDEEVVADLARLTGKRIEAQVAPKGSLRQAIKSSYAEIEVRDEGTSEFQLVDYAGREKAIVKVKPDDDLPEASVLDLEAIDSADPFDFPRIPAPSPKPAAAAPKAASPFPTIAPAPARPIPTPIPAPKPAAASTADSGEEAMRMLWALSDLLIEKGYFSRTELMAKLRGK